MTTSTSTSTNHNFASALTERQLEASFASIDWHAPWLYHLSQLDYLNETISSLSRSSDNQANLDRRIDDNQQTASIAKVLNQALTQQGTADTQSLPRTKPSADNHPHTLQFVSQNALPDGEAYEHFIGTTGKIPTRDNLHDLFNGSIWLTFPKTKAMLNYHHMLEIAKCSEEPTGSKNRGRVRDTITVFDENGAILVTSEASIGEALIDFDWQNSLVKPRRYWDKMDNPSKDAKAAVYIFGHALLEQLICPRKPLCAHSVVIHVSQDFFALSTQQRIAFLDDKLADYMNELLSKNAVTPRHLSPLPILGVPHFWSDNSEVSFYEDTFVFRSGRHRPKGR
ncbi:DUF3025 domain-containing protein [uncultured Psychrobacter sp.]|uniref:DUF3025 domain-containing protein n=1 Tax=uncultured Psychrobacter sp. TaxID=259303 RepID=UPI0026046BAA|nr:DUF3025 domain-containing protein [uncultured Psychrobacter sp.]